MTASRAVTAAGAGSGGRTTTTAASNATGNAAGGAGSCGEQGRAGACRLSCLYNRSISTEAASVCGGTLLFVVGIESKGQLLGGVAAKIRTIDTGRGVVCKSHARFAVVITADFAEKISDGSIRDIRVCYAGEGTEHAVAEVCIRSRWEVGT